MLITSQTTTPNFAPELHDSNYAPEMWALFESGDLRPDLELTGQFEESTESADVDTVLEEIKQAFIEEQNRLERIRESEAAG